MPKLCISEIDRSLGDLPLHSIVLMMGDAETYLDAVALDIIRRCTVEQKKRALIYVVNNEPDALMSLAESMGFPLKMYKEAGAILISKTTNVISALRAAAEEASLKIGAETYVLIDATSAIWEVSPSALAEAMQAHRKLVNGVTLLLCNPKVMKDPTLKEMLEEVSDFTLKLFSEMEAGEISRYLEIRYSKLRIVNFMRIYYALTPRGVEYSLQTQI